MRALVLSGGGAKGAYEAGLVSTLVQEYGETFDVICGTSIGAINAALIAQDDLNGLAALWHTIGTAKIVSPFPRVTALRNMFEAYVRAYTAQGLPRYLAWLRALRTTLFTLRQVHPLTELQTMLGLIDETPTRAILSPRLNMSAIKHILITTATDIATGTGDVFYYFPEHLAQLQAAFCQSEPCALPYEDATFAETIRASGAIPAAFTPVTLAHSKASGIYVDGGVINNTPIGQAIDAGAREITVLYLDPPANKADTSGMPTSVAAVLLSCFGIMQQRILELDYQMALRVNDAVGAKAQDTMGQHLVRLRTFRPNTTLGVGVLDFDRQDLIDAAFAQGQSDARNPKLRERWDT